MSDRLLLVGSIPFDTAQDVFENFGAPLGQYLASLPDGEIGPRRHWISRLHYQVFNGHPDLEVIRRPRPDDGVERLIGHDQSDAWQFKIRDGVKDIRFAEPGWRLGYARDAVSSYFVFRTLREKGIIPAHLRFQVSVPMVNSVVAPRTFTKSGDLEKMRAGFAVAMRDEVAKIVEKIPVHDLAIQWDCAWEITDVHGGIPEFSKEGAIARNVEQVRMLSPGIPEQVALGYHFCFGTFGGWPRFAPPDLGETVNLANAFVAASGRRVDWIHIPVLDRSDDEFFAPLARLEPQGAQVYLGAIHNMERFRERVATARKFLPEFGLGAPCGFGRVPVSELSQILADHIRAMA